MCHHSYKQEHVSQLADCNFSEYTNSNTPQPQWTAYWWYSRYEVSIVPHWKTKTKTQMRNLVFDFRLLTKLFFLPCHSTWLVALCIPVVPSVLKPFLNSVENQLKPVFCCEKAIKLTCSLRALTSRCSYLGMTWLMRHASDTTPFFLSATSEVYAMLPVEAFSCFDSDCSPSLLPFQIQNAEKRMSPPGHLRHLRVFAPIPSRQPSCPTGAPSASRRSPFSPPLDPPLLRCLQ